MTETYALVFPKINMRHWGPPIKAPPTQYVWGDYGHSPPTLTCLPVKTCRRQLGPDFAWMCVSKIKVKDMGPFLASRE